MSKWVSVDRRKTWAVVDRGRVVSRHVDFYNAQKAVERHLRNRKISNDYQIVPIDELGSFPSLNKLTRF